MSGQSHRTHRLATLYTSQTDRRQTDATL